MTPKMYVITILVYVGCILSVPSYVFAVTILIDHTSTKLDEIPEYWINQAKEKLHIAYGHSSHGSHLSKGMNGLYEWKGNLYAWNHGGSGGALDMHDYNRSFPSSSGIVEDLGSPNRTAWVDATREYLANNPEINVVIWAWCGQVDTPAHYIEDEYLSNMNQLEIEYPHVKFVYMTGHLNGTGLEGRVHTNNDIIRNYCRENGKILFDFEDIESYDPDGNYYGDKYATDGCNYDCNGDDRTDEAGDPATPLNGDRNWAIDWQNNHIEWNGTNDDEAEWYGYGSGSPLVGDEFRISHSQPVNQNMKSICRLAFVGTISRVEWCRCPN